MDPERVVIGTSAWGSRIAASRAGKVGRALLDRGFTRFDSAPTYGSGYAHHILDRLAATEAAAVVVDTKYGQMNEFGLRGWSKKILRAPSPRGFCDALWQHRGTRNDPDFWSRPRVLAAFERARETLQNCRIGTFYLHAPPFPVFGPILDRTEIADICDALAGHGVAFAIAEGSFEDVTFAADHPELGLRVQVGCAELFRHRDFFRDVARLPIHLNGIHRDRDRIANEFGIAGPKFDAAIESFLDANAERRLVIGVNSLRSVDRL